MKNETFVLKILKGTFHFFCDVSSVTILFNSSPPREEWQVESRHFGVLGYTHTSDFLSVDSRDSKIKHGFASWRAHERLVCSSDETAGNCRPIIAICSIFWATASDTIVAERLSFDLKWTYRNLNAQTGGFSVTKMAHFKFPFPFDVVRIWNCDKKVTHLRYQATIAGRHFWRYDCRPTKGRSCARTVMYDHIKNKPKFHPEKWRM